jgi:YD repeat-containing protein
MKFKFFIVILIVILLSLTFCNSNKTPDDNDNDNINNNETNEDKDSFLISKEIMYAIFFDHSYDYSELIEYITTKEYFYSEDLEVIDTKITSEALVKNYDDEGNLIDERPLTEEDDQSQEYYDSEYYIEHMDSFVENMKEPGNNIENRGELTYDEEGKIIKEIITYEDGRKEEISYKYDEKGRLIEKSTKFDGYSYDNYKFTYDDKDRVVFVSWGGGEYGFSQKSYTYENSLLVEIFEKSRSDTMVGLDIRIEFEYIKK